MRVHFSPQGTMDEPHIRIIRDSEASSLGSHPSRPAEVLPEWTGLRMVRYQLPSELTDRHVRAPHPILTLVCEGEAASRLRIGRQDLRNELRANDLMFYSGGKDIDYAHWQARAATMISVEFDPQRLCSTLQLDTPPDARTLRGAPRFHDQDLAQVLRVLWSEVHTGCPQGRLYADSLCLGLTTHVFRQFGPSLAERGNDHRARLSLSQLQLIDDYIDEHLSQSIGLDDLAQEVGLSR